MTPSLSLTQHLVEDGSEADASTVETPSRLPVFSRRETRVRVKSHVEHYTQGLQAAMEEINDIIYFDDAQASEQQRQAVQSRIQAYGHKVLQIMKEAQLWLHMYELTEPHRGASLSTLRHEIRSRRLCVNSIVRRTDGAYNLQRAVITDKAHTVSAMLSELSDANEVSVPTGWLSRYSDRSSQKRAAEERSASFR